MRTHGGGLFTGVWKGGFHARRGHALPTTATYMFAGGIARVYTAAYEHRGARSRDSKSL